LINFIYFYFTALVAEGFLDRTASQLTYHGLCELSSTVKPDQLCVFFRNNHFCTLFRQKVRNIINMWCGH